MTADQTRALITIALMAAFADGLKDERERARIKALAARLSGEGLDVDAIYEDVLLHKPALSSVASPLVRRSQRRAVRLRDRRRRGGRRRRAYAGGRRVPRAAPRDVAIAGRAVEAGDRRSRRDRRGACSGGVGRRAADASGQRRSRMPPSSTSASSMPRSPTPRSSCFRKRSRRWRSCRCRCGMVYRHRPVARLRARPGSHQGVHRDARRRPDRPVPRAVRAKAAGRRARQRARRHGPRGRAARRRARAWRSRRPGRSASSRSNTTAAGARSTLRGSRRAFTPLVEQGQSMIARYGPAIEERARSIDVRKLPQLISGCRR